MPTLVKLTTAGESVTMQVKSCEKNTVGQYPGFLFTGKDARGNLVTIEVPESATKRQLDRMDRTTASIVGHTVRISRDANAQNPSRPFWGINFAEGDADQPPEEETGAPPKPVAKAPPATPAVPKAGALSASDVSCKYLDLVDAVANHIRESNGQDFYDYATAQPIAATIWITMQNKGLV